MQLAVARNQVVEHRVQRRAEREEQRQDRQNGKTGGGEVGRARPRDSLPAERLAGGRSAGPPFCFGAMMRSRYGDVPARRDPVAAAQPADASPDQRQDRQACQQQRGQTEIVAPFDVVLDAPVNGSQRLAQGILRHGHPRPGPDVEVAVVRGIAEDVRQQEGEDLPRRPGPFPHLRQTGGALRGSCL